MRWEVESADDFAPANVFDVYGRRYRRQGQPDYPQANPPQ
jgi:hypothetical protein